MRYQRCTLCRKTKISYSLVPFSSPCNRSSNFIVNHHVSVLFSPLALSLSLVPSFPLPLSFFVRVLRYTPSNSFHCRCLLSATITRRVKDPSGNVNPILSPVYICSGAPRISATVSPLCIENFHPPWAIRCMPGRNVLVLDIAVEIASLLSLASFLILILLFGFLPFLSPFVCLSSSFITPFVWKTIRVRFLERFSTAIQQYDNKSQEFWEQSKTIHLPIGSILDANVLRA